MENNYAKSSLDCESCQTLLLTNSNCQYLKAIEYDLLYICTIMAMGLKLPGILHGWTESLFITVIKARSLACKTISLECNSLRTIEETMTFIE